jgi:hypothetical protein
MSVAVADCHVTFRRCGLALCYGNGDGTFQQPITYSLGDLEGNEVLVVGDFNGDHLLDVATRGSSAIWLLPRIPGGGFSWIWSPMAALISRFYLAMATVASVPPQGYPLPTGFQFSHEFPHIDDLKQDG